MMSKYIDVEPFENALMAVQKRSDVISIAEVLNTLMKYPAADVVSRGVLEQVMWERDLAVSQLAEIGKGFGEKMDGVVEVNAFRNEVYQYIDAYKDEDTNFLSGLETAVVIAEKMAGVYEEVEE